MSSSVEPFFGYGQQYGGAYGIEDITSPPYVENQVPAPGTSDVPSDQVLEFDLLQSELPILLDSVEIYVEDSPAYFGAVDTFVAPYDGVGSVRADIAGPPAGHHFEIQKDSSWVGGSSISVRVVAQDIGGAPLDQVWYVTAENLGPLITPLSPISAETEVDVNSNISIRIQDNNGISGGSIRVFVKEGIGDWELAYDGGGSPQFKEGWDGPDSSLSGNSTDKTLIIDKVGRFSQSMQVSVWVFAQDLSGRSERL